jgi:membrane protein YdbS with pleckstrin-like domain
MKAMSVRRFRTAAAVVWVAGIAGMIVNSIRGNNNGWVVTSGMATAIASIVVLAVTNATQHARVDVFEEADAERLEGQVSGLVDAGADETAVRTLVRDAMRAGGRRRS